MNRHRYLALVVTALAVVACGRQQAQEPPPPKVTVAHPVERELTDWDEYTARLEAVNSVEVRARVSGYLESVHFREGSMVQKGDLPTAHDTDDGAKALFGDPVAGARVEAALQASF